MKLLPIFIICLFIPTFANADVCCEVLQERLNGIDAKHTIRADLTDRMTALIKIELDRRLLSMNEFRDQLNDQAQTFARISEVMLLFDKIEAKIYSISERINRNEKVLNEKTGAKQWQDYILVVLIGLMVVIISSYIKDKITKNSPGISPQ